MRRIVVIGAGSIAENIVCQFNLENEVEYFHEDPISDGETKFSKLVEKRSAVIFDADYIACVGDTRHKRALIQELPNAHYRNFIDKTMWIAKNTYLQKGIYAQPYSVIWNDCDIQDHVTLLNTCSIGHNSKVKKYSIVCPEATIGGYCEVGEGVWVGANATIRENIKIGDGAFIGQGANVVKDVEPNTVVLGNPARFYNRLEEW